MCVGGCVWLVCVWVGVWCVFGCVGVCVGGLLPKYTGQRIEMHAQGQTASFRNVST